MREKVRTGSKGLKMACFVLFGLLNCSKPLNNMAMSTVAEQLRVAREARKLTIQQVADATKIRTDHIRALEEGNFNVFSAPIYIRGSVKNYAMLLKLDVPQIMAVLTEELGRTEKFSEPPPLTEASNTPLDRLMFLLSKLNWKFGVAGAAVLGIVLVIFFASFAWRHHKRSDPLAGLQPAVYQTADAGQTLPLASHH
jgi:cytoskeletal protein RodZ